MQPNIAIIIAIGAAIIVSVGAFVAFGGGNGGHDDDSIVGLSFDFIDENDDGTEKGKFKVESLEDGVFTTVVGTTEMKTVTIKEKDVDFSRSIYGKSEGKEKVKVNGQDLDATKYVSNDSAFEKFTAWVGNDGTAYKVELDISIFGQTFSEKLTIDGDYPKDKADLYCLYYAVLKKMHSQGTEGMESKTRIEGTSFGAKPVWNFDLKMDGDEAMLYIWTDDGSMSGSEYFGSSDIQRIGGQGIGELTGTATIDTRMKGEMTLNVYKNGNYTIYADKPDGTIYKIVYDFEGGYEYNTLECSGMDATANAFLVWCFKTARIG